MQIFKNIFMITQCGFVVITSSRNSYQQPTCWCSGHNSECSHGLSTNIMAIEQEAGQVLHVIELTTQDLLGPFTHQSAGSRSHVIFGTWGLARRLHQLTLQTFKGEQWVDEYHMTSKGELDRYRVIFQQCNLPHHQISADPGWVRMACEQKLSSLTHYNSM